jgi:hypothetical protein
LVGADVFFGISKAGGKQQHRKGKKALSCHSFQIRTNLNAFGDLHHARVDPGFQLFFPWWIVYLQRQ